MLGLVRYLFVISTSVIDCLERFVFEMTYYVSSETLNLTKLKLISGGGQVSPLAHAYERPRILVKITESVQLFVLTSKRQRSGLIYRHDWLNVTVSLSRFAIHY